jgi:membrane-associated phospholipid phosphatase
MKKILLSTWIVLMAMVGSTQTAQPLHSANYEAANWSTWIVDNPQQITIDAPPSIDVSQVELKTIKKRMANVDEKKLAEIKYWDTGAPAYRWNQITPDLIETRQDLWLRMPTAWVNLAIYDATVMAWREKVKYKRKRPNEMDPSMNLVIPPPVTYSYPCEHTVTAAAAATVLAYFIPEKADSILQLAHAAGQSRIDAGVQFPSDVEAGWKLGEQVGKAIIARAKNDESVKPWDGSMNKDPAKWTGSYPVGLTLASFTPIVLQSGDQFRPPAPPDFEADMKELKNFNQTFKSRSLAYYWANSGGFGFWSDIAGLKMFEYRMSDDAPAVARIYTVLHTAFHDAAIAIMDAKYTYWGIRPDQYDTTYTPLLSTPPFPGYPSGHATAAATTSTVLGYFFPADKEEFRQQAQDCADSRFYAGIHFRSDNETGLRMGKEIGKYIVETWMRKTVHPGSQ